MDTLPVDLKFLATSVKSNKCVQILLFLSRKQDWFLLNIIAFKRYRREEDVEENNSEKDANIKKHLTQLLRLEIN